jgi:hypothetical protein
VDLPNHVRPNNNRRRLFVGLFMAATFGMMIVLSLPLARFLPVIPRPSAGILGLPALLGPLPGLPSPLPHRSPPAVEFRPVAAQARLAVVGVSPSVTEGRVSGGRVGGEGPPRRPRGFRTVEPFNRSVQGQSPEGRTVCRRDHAFRSHRHGACQARHRVRNPDREERAHGSDGEPRRHDHQVCHGKGRHRADGHARGRGSR